MSKPYYRIIRIVLTVACGVCALVTMPIALLTATRAFDTPDSSREVWAWVGFFAILSIPFWFIIGAIAGWALHLHGWTRTSLVLSAAPLGAALISLLLFGAI
jgi:hypothetical protein